MLRIRPLQTWLLMWLYLVAAATLSGRGPLKRTAPEQGEAEVLPHKIPRTAEEARLVRHRRAKYRQKQFMPESRGRRATDSSFLEQQSVGPTTRRSYESCMVALEDFAKDSGAPNPQGEQLVHCVLDFLDFLFFKGHPVDDGKKLLSALKFNRLEFRPGNLLQTHRIDRALRGWNRHSIPRRRLPMPFHAMMAIVGHMVAAGRLWSAIALMLAFHLYLRPGEWYSLRSENLIPPAPLAGLPCWTINLALEEHGKPSKSGKFDEALLLDLPHHQVLNPFLRKLHKLRKGNDTLWIYTQANMIKQLTEATSDLGLQPLQLEWYCARHGGASHDLAMKFRNVSDIKRRLRHASDLTVRHYERSGKLARAVHLMPKVTLDFGIRIGKELGSILASQRVPGQVPRLHASTSSNA